MYWGAEQFNSLDSTEQTDRTYQNTFQNLNTVMFEATVWVAGSQISLMFLCSLFQFIVPHSMGQKMNVKAKLEH